LSGDWVTTKRRSSSSRIISIVRAEVVIDVERRQEKKYRIIIVSERVWHASCTMFICSFLYFSFRVN
jgi:hypothetical protein